MAKKKERKKTVDEINIINNFKIYINKYTGLTNYIQSVDFEEESDKDSFRVIANLDCGAFKQRIIYYPEMLFEEHFIDTEFQFDNSEYIYRFYDIFNLFDIDDFKLYYYGGLMSMEDVEKAVKDIFEATEKYFSEIEKAGSEVYLSDLEKNYETDMKNSYGSDDWKEDLKDDISLFLVPPNHPLLSFADGQLNQKAIKKLKKKNEKGKLDTIYEKRLLKYIEAGNTVERKNIVDNEAFEKLYSRKILATNLIIFLITFVVLFIVSFVCHAVLFKGAVVFTGTYEIFGLSLSLPLDRIALCAFSAFAITIDIAILFGIKLVMKKMPDEMKNKAGVKYDKDSKNEYGKFSKLIAIVGGIFVFLLGIASFFASVEDVGYYDNYVKFPIGIFGVGDVNYEDLEIYKVKGYYDGDDEYVLNENEYAISDNKGNYYSIGEVAPGGKAETKLKEIAEKYNKEIVEIDTIDELNSDISE